MGEEQVDEGFYDDSGRWWPKDAEWCDRCQGMGVAECLCGGDQCYCENYGEVECPRCRGEGYFVPTAAFKAAREEHARWWSELQAQQTARRPPMTATVLQCDRIYVQFAENGHIRKWSQEPFDDGVLYTRHDSTREMAEALRNLRPLLQTVEDAINEPPRLWDIEPMEVRDYRHTLYRQWTPLCRAILALQGTDR